MAKISIIVCTFNRADVLEDCLDSLVNQTVSGEFYEVVVVNNNSTDSTLAIAEKYARHYKNFRFVTEVRQGLSYARNRGFRESTYDWVSYIDDDAKAFPDFVERASNTIDQYNFDCFGGMFYPWYRNRKRPKWLDEDFGQSIKYKENVGLLDNGYITGCVCMFKKKALEEIGGFPVDLGMTGDKIAYGEEVFVQRKLSAEGYEVGFDPELCIEHLVADYKLTLKWHLQSEYAQGRDAVKIFNEIENISSFKFLKTVIKIFLRNFLRNSVTLIKRRNYYIQNLFLDTLKPVAQYSGFYFANKKQNV